MKQSVPLKNFNRSASCRFGTRPLILLYYLATTTPGNDGNTGVDSVCVSVNGMCALSPAFLGSVWEASWELFHVVFSVRVITTAEMLMAVWIRHGTRGHQGLGAVFDLLIPSAQRVLNTVFLNYMGVLALRLSYTNGKPMFLNGETETLNVANYRSAFCPMWCCSSWYDPLPTQLA